MPHLSKTVVPKNIQTLLDDQILAFLGDQNTKRRRDIFKELFTATERQMISKRLALLHLLSRGVPTLAISEALKMSPSTVARFELSADTGKFKAIQKWLNTEKNPLVRLFDNWLSLATHKRPSLHKIMEDLG